MADFKQGDSLPELRVVPDAGLTKRYAQASGDPNPIHTDPDFAKSVGLPGVILHGLYSMAQVARAHTEAAGGDPRGALDLWLGAVAGCCSLICHRW